ncbi:hypothetical protein K443DRAFT_390858 [Laccaria amethystina LaAM-08-1]|uniref:Uncharacterized protein n=1 Tax=Laccaria amethystina LaAM-08-1 TaxID=1095629 RepID=A0A0C9YNM9_9AGAR|nr:hypothetical protein K443DRAFT_390858 [Laccaria amethystina LaAM-08-1]
MSATLVRTRVLKKVFDENVSLNINPSTTRLHLVGQAQSTVLSSFENLYLVSPSPSHEQDLVNSAVNARITFEQLPINEDLATSKTSASLDQFKQQLEAFRADLTTANLHIAELTAANIRFEKQGAELAAANIRHEKHGAELAAANIRHEKQEAELMAENGDLKAVVQLLKDDVHNLKVRIRPLACIALRVFLDAFLATKGYNPDTCGSRKVWIAENIEYLLPNTGASKSRFESFLNDHRDVADTNARTTESLEVALAIEVMDEGKLEFSQLFKECLGHSIEAEIHQCIASTLIDGRIEKRAGQKVVRFVVTRPHAKSRACRVAS